MTSRRPLRACRCRKCAKPLATRACIACYGRALSKRSFASAKQMILASRRPIASPNGSCGCRVARQTPNRICLKRSSAQRRLPPQPPLRPMEARLQQEMSSIPAGVRSTAKLAPFSSLAWEWTWATFASIPIRLRHSRPVASTREPMRSVATLFLTEANTVRVLMRESGCLPMNWRMSGSKEAIRKETSSAANRNPHPRRLETLPSRMSSACPSFSTRIVAS